MAKTNTTEILKNNWLGGILAIILAYFIYAQKPHIILVGFFAQFTLTTALMIIVLYVAGAYVQSAIGK